MEAGGYRGSLAVCFWSTGFRLEFFFFLLAICSMEHGGLPTI